MEDICHVSLYMQFSLAYVQMSVQDHALLGWLPASTGPCVCVLVSMREEETIWMCMFYMPRHISEVTNNTARSSFISMSAE